MPVSAVADRSDTEIELRLSEVLAGLSHALDITEGQPRGHTERSCVIGMRLVGALGLDDATRSSAFYALLLKDAGCSSNASKVAALFGTDDAVVKSTRRLTDTSSRSQAVGHLLRTVAPGQSPLTKAQHVAAVLRFGSDGARSLVAMRCERGAGVARAIGLGEVVARAILDVDEHWDGRGYPAGIAGDEISLIGRVLCLAQTTEVFWRHGGPSAACAIARERRGTWFDPELVDALLPLEHDDEFWRRLETPVVAGLEPPDRVLLADHGRLDLVAEAFASVIDAKSPYTARHSEGVADIAVSLELVREDRATLRRAALLHDIGKLGVSSRILDKPGPLNDAEREVVRLHPRWSREILTRITAFEELARIAGSHHERLDGSGYPSALTADELDLPTRILAVAEALTADRPYRQALSADEVIRTIRGEAGRTLHADACEALEDVLPARVQI